MTTLEVDDTAKMIRETLCVAQTFVGLAMLNEQERIKHVMRLQRLIDACDEVGPVDE